MDDTLGKSTTINYDGITIVGVSTLNNNSIFGTDNGRNIICGTVTMVKQFEYNEPELKYQNSLPDIPSSLNAMTTNTILKNFNSDESIILHAKKLYKLCIKFLESMKFHLNIIIDNSVPRMSINMVSQKLIAAGYQVKFESNFDSYFSVSSFSHDKNKIYMTITNPLL